MRIPRIPPSLPSTQRIARRTAPVTASFCNLAYTGEGWFWLYRKICRKASFFVVPITFDADRFEEPVPASRRVAAGAELWAAFQRREGAKDVSRKLRRGCSNDQCSDGAMRVARIDAWHIFPSIPPGTGLCGCGSVQIVLRVMEAFVARHPKRIG